MSGQNYINRQMVFIALCAAVLLLSLPSEAQQKAKTPRIVVLTGSTLAALKFRAEGFRKGLQELGWIEDQNIAVEYRSTDGNMDRLSDVAAELVRQNVDLIVATSEIVVWAALKATKTTPIVMMAIAADPVETGLISSLAKPGGNITGTTAIYQNLTGKQLELLKEAFPKLSRIGVLWNPDVMGSAQGYKQLHRVAPSMGVQLRSLEIRKATDIDTIFTAIAKNPVAGLVIVSDPISNSNRPKIADLAAKTKIPAIYGARSWVEDGGLMSYGTDLVESSRRSAVYVDKILKGAKPAELPVEQPTKFEFIINLKAAKQIGLTIPPNVLARADRVIR